MHKKRERQRERQRERERERERWKVCAERGVCREIENVCKSSGRECVCVCLERGRVYGERVTERERERERWKMCAERGKECVLK